MEKYQELKKEDVERIIDFYKPLIKHGALYFDAPKHKMVSTNVKNPVILTFGYPARTEKDALENGGIITNGLILYSALFPEEWEKVRSHYEDLKTEKYLDEVKKEIGFIKTIIDDKEVRFKNISYEMNTIYTTVTVGMDEDGNWVAENEVYNGMDDPHLAKHYYKRLPKERDLKVLELIEDIEIYFINGYDEVTFDCCQCGRKIHWTESEADNLREKWTNFGKKYCGCR